jgi:hypothetical protein
MKKCSTVLKPSQGALARSGDTEQPMSDHNSLSDEQTAIGSHLAQANNHSSANVIQYIFNINNVEQLNVPGTLLPKDQPNLIPFAASPGASITRKESAQQLATAKQWVRGPLIYEFSPGGTNVQIEAAINGWQFASSSTREPLATIAQGVIGIGHEDGVTFSQALLLQLMIAVLSVNSGSSITAMT